MEGCATPRDGNRSCSHVFIYHLESEAQPPGFAPLALGFRIDGPLLTVPTIFY